MYYKHNITNLFMTLNTSALKTIINVALLVFDSLLLQFSTFWILFPSIEFMSLDSFYNIREWESGGKIVVEYQEILK